MLRRNTSSSLNLGNSSKTNAKEAKPLWKFVSDKLVPDHDLHSQINEKDLALRKSIPFRVGTYVSSKNELKDFEIVYRKGVYLLMGMFALQFGFALCVFFSFSPRFQFFSFVSSSVYTILCVLLLSSFLITKNESLYFNLHIILFLLYPYLLTFQETELPLIRAISRWSFLAPFCSILFGRRRAFFWFVMFLLAQLDVNYNHQVLSALWKFFYYLKDSNVFEAISNPLASVGLSSPHSVPAYFLVDMAFFSTLFFGTRFFIAELRTAQGKIKVLNAFLMSHNRKLAKEQKEMSQLRAEQFDVHSPAEKIITIMRNLRSQNVFNEEDSRQIDFVISSIASGKDLYTPDVQKLQFGNKIDIATRSLILYHRQSSSSLYEEEEAYGVSSAPGNLHSLSPGFSHGTKYVISPETETILSKIGNWNFDIFALSQATNGKPLYYVGQALFRRYDLIAKFNIDESRLHNFLTSVESGYRSQNPYHNNIHASDVAQTLSYFISKSSLGELLNDKCVLAAIVSALIHDIDHPGVNNNFEVNRRSELALLYNDVSVLENHHLAFAFKILKNDENNIFKQFSYEMFKELRTMIIDLVLATDFNRHLEIFGQFKSRKSTGDLSASNPSDRLLAMKIALKCADISHTAKARELHLVWTKNISEEFFLQGDLEKKFQLPPSPFMDRATTNMAKSQTGFINFLVLPLYQAFVEQFPETNICLEQLEQNLKYWKDLDK